MNDKIHNIKNKITNFDNLLIVPYLGFGVSLIFMILISCASRNEIIFYPLNFTYKGFENFVEFYNFPLKLALITLTSWGILVAYRTYIQTKNQFIILNKAWISSKILFERVMDQETGQLTKPVLIYNIENNYEF